MVNWNLESMKGCRIAVTGGAQGIGAGICLGFAAAGAIVAILDCQEDKAKNISDEIRQFGGVATSINSDISTRQGCIDSIVGVVREIGGLDVLVNCAAPGRDRKALGQLKDNDWGLHEQLVINAPILLASAASDYLEASGFGSIINISSLVGSSVAADQCSWPYHVSKAGLEQMTRYLAVHLGSKGIRCNAIAPGLVDRASHEGHKLTDNPNNRRIIEEIVPLRRAGVAKDIAQAAIFLASTQASYIT
jgi:3-oxoacyl-[acyl-carrier protein] reductase